MTDMNHDLKILASSGYRYVFLDEVTLMDDFIDMNVEEYLEKL